MRLLSVVGAGSRQGREPLHGRRVAEKSTKPRIWQFRSGCGTGIKQIPPYEFRCCLPKRTNENCLENFLDVINSDASYCFLFNVALAEKLIEPKLLKQQRDDMAEPEG
jgi:hypothetical protein